MCQTDGCPNTEVALRVIKQSREHQLRICRITNVRLYWGSPANVAAFPRSPAPSYATSVAQVTCTHARIYVRSPKRAHTHAQTHFRTRMNCLARVRTRGISTEALAKQILYHDRMEAIPTHERTHARTLAHARGRAWAWASGRRCVSTSAPGFATTFPMVGCTSAPALRAHRLWDCAHICAGTGQCPHLRRDSLAHVYAETGLRAHLRPAFLITKSTGYVQCNGRAKIR